MKTLLSLFVVLAALLARVDGKSLEVTSLHPLLTDLATNIGGANVEVIGVMKRGSDPHDFSPSPSDLSRIAGSDIVLAMGKNLEPYLPKLRDNLRSGQTLVEVGRTVPSLKISKDDELFLCCPTHSVGAIDPHWWHSIRNMRRAARVVADEFAKADPAHASDYKAAAKQYDRKLGELERWAKGQIKAIPRKNRVLATPHLAFGYFCKEFGFRAVGIQGLTHDHKPSAQHLESIIETIQREKVKALFPEKGSNPKILTGLARDTGVKVGAPLDASGNATGNPVTYEAVVRNNVNAIVQGLK